MNYYYLEFDNDKNNIGHFPQVKQIVHNCDVNMDPMFIKNYTFLPAPKNSIVSFPELDPRSKLTDFIQVGGMGFFTNLVTSAEFAKTVDEHSDDDFQYFPCKVIHRKSSHNYILIHPTISRFDLIDYDRSEIGILKGLNERIELLKLEDCAQFMREKERIETIGYPYSIKIQRCVLSQEKKPDIFVISNISAGYRYFISEFLKDTFERANFTGVRYCPFNH